MLSLELIKKGFYVFPVGEDKAPLTAHGVKDASNDEEQVKSWWKKYPNAKVGVHTGKSGIIVLDIDVKVNDKGEIVVDGFTSLDENWKEVPDTFGYDSSNGLGRHLIFRAPEGVNLSRSINYDNLQGVDRLAGEGYVVWVGGVPSKKDLAPAPEWMCAPGEKRKEFKFDGDLGEWFDNLVPGKPNALVRRALKNINPDMGHSEMVAAQHHAIRLGAEGNSGVEELLDALRTAWETRPAENHTTPEEMWGYKFEEAFRSGLNKYGAITELRKSLPEYHIGMVPAQIPDSLITTPSGTQGFSALLGALTKEINDDKVIASILWNCPATEELARDWGLEFTFKRIQDAREKPEPTRENPRIEEERERELVKGTSGLELLTPTEREEVKKYPTFVDHVVEVAKDFGYDQFPYFRSIAWVTASMAFSFKGFIPVTSTHKMGLNLWFICPGDSGTGKSVSSFFRDAILKSIFSGEDFDGVGYDLGDDSSPQGLHMALLERDRRASLFASDEAAGFFSTLGLRDWKTGLDEKLTSWYNGYVAPSNKLSQLQLRGKSALTSFNMHMFGTPDKLSRVVTSEMFETGFMARVNWMFGNPPREDGSRFDLTIDTSDEASKFDENPEATTQLAIDLLKAVEHINTPVALTAESRALKRMSEAYEKMYKLSEGRENWAIIEPSITRLSETMMKCAGICAMYRGDTKILLEDALNAIQAVEEFLVNLHRMAGMIVAGDFQRNATAIESWIRSRGGKATRAAIFNRFRNFIQKDSRELDSLLTFLVESGILNREATEGNAVKYELNGG